MTSSIPSTRRTAWSRHKLLLAAGAAAGALALAACSSSPAPASGTSTGKVTLTFWSWVPRHLAVGQPVEQEPSRAST